MQAVSYAQTRLMVLTSQCPAMRWSQQLKTTSASQEDATTPHNLSLQLPMAALGVMKINGHQQKVLEACSRAAIGMDSAQLAHLASITDEEQMEITIWNPACPTRCDNSRSLDPRHCWGKWPLRSRYFLDSRRAQLLRPHSRPAYSNKPLGRIRVSMGVSYQLVDPITLLASPVTSLPPSLSGLLPELLC